MNPFAAANRVKSAKQSAIRRGRMADPEYSAGYAAGYEAGSGYKKRARAQEKARERFRLQPFR